METFDFYLDTKVTTWYRTRFEIEGKNLKDAKKKAIEFVKNEEHSSISWDMIDDTIEEMNVGDNGGEPTEELFNQSGDCIWDNTKTN
jgi:hypothetical protein